jgi:ABC-type lipoprotein release transport system permease subunit
MSDSARLVVAGLVAGLPASVAAASWTHALVQGAAEWDPLTLVAAAAITSVLTLVASYLPARRASKHDPTSALRLKDKRISNSS